MVDIGTYLETSQGNLPDLQGDYNILKMWYLHTLVRKPYPS